MTEAERQSRHLFERGYAVFERAFDDDELHVFRQVLVAIHGELGSPACYSPTPKPLGHFIQTVPTGLVIAKLIERRPDFADRMLKAPIVEAIRGYLGDGMRLELTAAVLADASRPIFPWHTHIGGQDDTRYRTLGQWPSIDRPLRVGTLMYLDDLTDESGPLLLYPRAVGSSTAPPYDTTLAHWPGEVVVRVPRGSLVVMDECTWHTARQMTSPGLRILVGCNFAARSAPPSPVLEEALATLPGGELFRSVTR